MMFCIVEADDLLFDYRILLINYLGTIANAIDNKLTSPWNLDVTHVDSSSDVGLLQRTIIALLENETLKKELVSETLHILDTVIDNYRFKATTKLQELSKLYNNSYVYSLFVDDGVITKRPLCNWADTNVQKLSKLIFDILLLGWHYSDLFKAIREPCVKTFLKYDYYTYGTDYSILAKDTKIKYIFVTSFKHTLEVLLQAHGFDSAHISIIENVEDLVMLNDLEYTFKVFTKNTSFIYSVSGALIRSQSITSNSEILNKSYAITEHIKGSKIALSYNRVDLYSKFKLDSSPKIIGSFLQLHSPISIEGTVIKGNNRGLKLLGIPTGVYYGYARLIGNEEVEDTLIMDSLISVGFNPHFVDKKYAIECYICRKFKNGFLGQTVILDILGFIRTDGKYNSINELIYVIQHDLYFKQLINVAKIE